MKAGGLHAIEALLADRIGLDPAALPRGMLGRAAKKRMEEIGTDDLASYALKLAASEPELLALTEEVVVPETWFFRDEKPFAWLRDQIATRWLREPALPRLRVLSLPCSSGEEPFSIAIALSKAGLPKNRFTIDAVDVSARRLESARAGVYSANAFRGPAATATEGFFRPHAEGFEIDPAIRALVRFHRASALDPNLFKSAQLYHIIFCRNLLIYLCSTARERVESTLDRLLESDGWLVLGHADRLGGDGRAARFQAVGDPACFTYRKLAASSPSPSAIRHKPIHKTSPIIPPASRPSVQLEIAEDLLAEAETLANQKRHALAVAACERAIQRYGPSAQAYHLLGTIHHAQGDRDRAEDCFRKTVYLDPRHELALLSLALLAEQKGDHTAAAGFRRRAKRRHSAETN